MTSSQRVCDAYGVMRACRVRAGLGQSGRGERWKGDMCPAFVVSVCISILETVVLVLKPEQFALCRSGNFVAYVLLAALAGSLVAPSWPVAVSPNACNWTSCCWFVRGLVLAVLPLQGLCSVWVCICQHMLSIVGRPAALSCLCCCFEVVVA